MVPNTLFEVAAEWANKILQSRMPQMPALTDYLPAAVADVERQQASHRDSLLPSAIETYAHRNGLQLSDLPDEAADELRIEILRAVAVASRQQADLDLRVYQTYAGERGGVSPPVITPQG